jgi:hypothetical protein
VSLKAWFGIFAAIFSAIAYIPYVIAILKTRNRPESEQVRPNRASWAIWWLIDVTVFASSIAAGVYQTAWVFLSFTVGSTAVVALSIKLGEGGWTSFDRFCLFTGLSGLVLWWITNTPQTALFMAAFSATIGTIPTVLKGWKRPKGEDLLTWVLFFIGGLLNVLAIAQWDLTNALPPVNVWILQIFILMPLLVHRWKPSS